MKNLSKTQQKELSDLVERLRDSSDLITAAVTKFNETMTFAWDGVAGALEAYNSVIQEANAFREQVAADQQSYIDDRSEKWQESDAGQAYEAWKQEWEGTLDELQMDPPQEAEEPDLSAADTLEGLPEQVE